MINLPSLNFLGNIQPKTTNPINFGGNIDELACDSFTKTTADIDVLPINIDEDIEKLKNQLTSLDIEIQEMQKKLAAIKKERCKLLEAKLQMWSKVSNNQCPSIELEKIKNMESRTRNDYETQRNKLDVVCERRKNIEKSLKYLEQLKLHPKTAFMYNPDLKPEDIKEQLSRLSSDILTIDEFANRVNLRINQVRNLIGANILVSDSFGLNEYIDITYKPNIAANDMLAQKADSLMDMGEFCSRYNFRESEFVSLFASGKLICFDRDDLIRKNKKNLIDISDEINLRTLQEHLKTTPIRSKQYYKSADGIYNNMVPVTYLSKLGFGTSQQILKAIQDKKLKGAYNFFETKEGKKCVAQVDISSADSERYLQIMRDENKSVKDIKQLAKILHCSPSAIKEALLNDELEIIPEYIFSSDFRYSFIDLSNKKNKEFVDKTLFEYELEQSLKLTKKERENKYASIRMKLVWALCPYTRKVASEELKKQIWIKPIFDKKMQEGEEALTSKEQIQLKSYFKDMWLKAGVDEYNNAISQAREILAQYKRGGIEAVSDPEMREILINILSDDI